MFLFESKLVPLLLIGLRHHKLKVDSLMKEVHVNQANCLRSGSWTQNEIEFT